jgi:thioesterase domain-containing protein/acyl carrier protein
VTRTDAAREKSARWNRLARELEGPDRLLARLAGTNRRARPLAGPPAFPRTETERQLAAIWTQCLGLEEVGIRDDYFALGGTSLVAVTIFSRIERELGRRLPLASLLEHPTIEGLAARLQSRAPSASPSLVALREAGDAPALFLVHDADGETMLYRSLALRLGGGRPVYGIRPLGRDDTPTVHTRIEDMAAHYVAEMRTVQPHGPYLLGGLCAGGVLAFEMARQLEAAGEEARLVAVFDAADVEARPRPHLEAARRFRRVGRALREASLRRLPGVLAAKARGYLTHEVESRARAAHQRFAVATLRLCLDRGWPLPRWARNLPIRTVYTQAESRYRPRSRVREEIVLYRATSGEGSDEPYVQLYDDPLLGWGPRSEKGVRTVDVPGGHGSMLREPEVAALADALCATLGDGHGGSRGLSVVREKGPGR